MLVLLLFRADRAGTYNIAYCDFVAGAIQTDVIERVHAELGLLRRSQTCKAAQRHKWDEPMNFVKGLILLSVLALAACEPVVPQIGPDGRPLPQLYRIGASDTSRITFGMLDSVNALRLAVGAPALALNAPLTSAAATHARDMAVQNRPWHFGSDGSSPLDRGMRAGYIGEVLGENISETYETETETLAAWMDLADTRDVVLNPLARDLGFAWFQEASGKIWWVLLTGG